MCGINLFAEAEKHLGFQGIENFPFDALFVDSEENYVINGSTSETMLQYVSLFLVCCFPMILCFISVVVAFLRLLTSDEYLFLKQNCQPPLQFQVNTKARDHMAKYIIVKYLDACVALQRKFKIDCGNTKVSFSILEQSMCSSLSVFEKLLNFILI